MTAGCWTSSRSLSALLLSCSKRLAGVEGFAQQELHLTRQIHSRTVSTAAAAQASSSQAAETEGAQSDAEQLHGRGFRETAQVGPLSTTFEAGRLANMADGACTLQVGGSQVLATVVADDSRVNMFNQRQHNLQADYRERLFAAGRIPRTVSRFEGRPSDREEQVQQMLLRVMRAMLPRELSYRLQVATSVLSSDRRQETDMMAINAASAAMTLSDIPWPKPLGAVRVSLVKNRWVVSPTPREMQDAELNLAYAGTEDGTVLADAEARCVSDDLLAEGLHLAQREAQKLIAPQLRLQEALGRVKRQRLGRAGADPLAVRIVKRAAQGPMEGVVGSPGLGTREREEALKVARAKTVKQLELEGRVRRDRVPGSGTVSELDIDAGLNEVMGDLLSDMALQKSRRIDGRALYDVRPATFQAEKTGAVFGSLLAEYGGMQVLTHVTVGGPGDAPRSDGLLPDSRRNNVMVHFSVPAFASAEANWRGAPSGLSGEELAVGQLVEAALNASLPRRADFPFAVRINADVLALDGAPEGLAISAASLALRSARIPLQHLIAGVTVGMLEKPVLSPEARAFLPKGANLPEGMGPDKVDLDAKIWELVVDMQEAESHVSPMELTVAGTADSLTALRLQARRPIPLEVLLAALPVARRARADIIPVMAASMPEAEEQPRVATVNVMKEMLGRVIGQQGSGVRAIESSTGALISVPGREADNGKSKTAPVTIYAPNDQSLAAAVKGIKDASGLSIKEGDLTTCEVVKLMDYGAFVELPTGEHALLHISEISLEKVRSVPDVVSVGQTMEVMITGRDKRGNVQVSRKAVLKLSIAPAA